MALEQCLRLCAAALTPQHRVSRVAVIVERHNARKALAVDIAPAGRPRGASGDALTVRTCAVLAVPLLPGCRRSSAERADAPGVPQRGGGRARVPVVSLGARHSPEHVR
jgi:hypothetical protein